MVSRSSTPHVGAYAADGAGDAATRGTVSDPAYMADAITDGAPYTPNPNLTWAPTVTVGDGQGVPDPSRLGVNKRHDRRANLLNPWAWWARVNGDINKRHADAETVDSDGMQENARTRHYADDPRWNPPAPSRPTSLLSPSRWSFTRPFGQHTAREFTGAHFSMADHRKKYDILTMTPVSQRRNTYRVEPKPWDNDIVDVAPDPNAGLPYERYSAPPVTPSAVGNSWRLG